MPNHLQSDTEECLQISELILDESTSHSSNPVHDRSSSNYTTGLNLSQSDESGHKVTNSFCEKTNKFQDMIESCSSAMKDTLKESLEEVYHKLEVIEQNTQMEFRNIIQRNKEQCKETEKKVEKNIKEVKETIKLQHREARRRFERLEKKANVGYFN